MYRVVTTDHPEQKGLVLKHGPYTTKVEAEQYAEKLRQVKGWGKVTVDNGSVPQPHIL